MMTRAFGSGGPEDVRNDFIWAVDEAMKRIQRKKPEGRFLLSEITQVVLERLYQDKEHAKHFGDRKTICVHCDIEVPGNVPCPKCGR